MKSFWFWRFALVVLALTVASCTTVGVAGISATLEERSVSEFVAGFNSRNIANIPLHPEAGLIIFDGNVRVREASALEGLSAATKLYGGQGKITLINVRLQDEPKGFNWVAAEYEISVGRGVFESGVVVFDIVEGKIRWILQRPETLDPKVQFSTDIGYLAYGK